MTASRVSVFRDCRNIVGESPLWDRARQCLWWVDIGGLALHRAWLEGSGIESWSVPAPPAAMALDQAGHILLAVGHDLCRFAPDAAQWSTLATNPAPLPATRFNDGVTDAAGRFWLGTLHDARDPVGTLYCYDGQTLHARETGLRTQNGCAVSPDGTTFYLADSHPDIRSIWAYDLDGATGALENRRLFHRVERGRPDGAAIDADGCYWFAAVDGGCVTQLDPTGAVMRSIDLPVSRPTKPAFGGPDLTTLFVTSMTTGTDPAREPLAGAVLAIEALAKGIELWRFGPESP
jgi:L-arabinonolactonase